MPFDPVSMISSVSAGALLIAAVLCGAWVAERGSARSAICFLVALGLFMAVALFSSWYAGFIPASFAARLSLYAGLLSLWLIAGALSFRRAGLLRAYDYFRVFAVFCVAGFLFARLGVYGGA